MPLQNTPPAGDNPRPQRETYSILIVDEDELIAESLANHLRELGHRIAGIAWSSREALPMARRVQPDVVMMDIHMRDPDGVRRACDMLLQERVPIVLTAELSDSWSPHRAADLDVISYLVKPFSPAQLKMAVRLAIEHCRRASRRDPEEP